MTAADNDYANDYVSVQHCADQLLGNPDVSYCFGNNSPDQIVCQQGNIGVLIGWQSDSIDGPQGCTTNYDVGLTVEDILDACQGSRSAQGNGVIYNSPFVLIEVF
jgi:hypothetical protein